VGVEKGEMGEVVEKGAMGEVLEKSAFCFSFGFCSRCDYFSGH
jgi:hypothetical protein